MLIQPHGATCFPQKWIANQRLLLAAVQRLHTCNKKHEKKLENETEVMNNQTSVSLERRQQLSIWFLLA